MDDRILKLIVKYNMSSIPDNHYAVSELMQYAGKSFEYENKTFVLKVIPISGVHNVQLYRFFMVECNNC